MEAPPRSWATPPRRWRNGRPWEGDDKSVAFTELHALAFANLDGDEIAFHDTGKRWWSHGYIYDENDVDNPPVLYRFQLVRKPGGAVEWIPSLIHNASGVGTRWPERSTRTAGLRL